MNKLKLKNLTSDQTEASSPEKPVSSKPDYNSKKGSNNYRTVYEYKPITKRASEQQQSTLSSQPPPKCLPSTYDSKGHSLLVLLPLSVPGIGKTYFFKNLERGIAQSGLDMRYARSSSDEIRKRVMEGERSRNPQYKNLTSDELHSATNDTYNRAFEEKMNEEITNVGNSDKKTVVLALDKNFTLSEAQTLIGNIKKFINGKINTKFV